MRAIKDFLMDTNSDKQSGHRYGFVYDLLFTKVFQAKGFINTGTGSMKMYQGMSNIEGDTKC